MRPISRSVRMKLDLKKAYDRVKADLDGSRYYFDKMKEIGLRNLNFYVGNQWSADEIDAHHQQNREPLVFNEILHKVDHLVGSQMQTKMDSKTVGREPMDEAGAQLLTYLLKWAEQVNDISDLETTVFRNGIVAGYSACSVSWDTEDVPYGYPKVDYIPFGQLSWDPRAYKYDLSDARWLCRSALMSRIELAELFPEHYNFIYDSSNTPDSYHVSYQEPIDRKLNIDGYSTLNQDRELLEYYEHYERVKMHRWLVIDDVRGEVMRFDDQKDAEEYYSGLVEGYLKENIEITLMDDIGTERVQLMHTSTNKIIQTIIIGDKAVSRELLDTPDFPYVVYFAYWVEGTFFGFVDNLIDPQIEVNRSWSQWDYALGTQNKGVKTVIESLLKRGWTTERVRAEASKTNVYIPVVSHAALNHFQETPVNPQIFNTIEFAISRMTDYSGGRNVLGFSENAAESGKAVTARAQAGGVSRLSLFDNLRKWRLKVAERIVWYLKNYSTPQQIVRLIGNNEDIYYVNLDQGILDSLKEMKTDIVVSEAISSDSISERYFNQLVNFFQVTSVPPEIAMPMLLEYTSLPETKKEELRQYFELYKQYMQEQAKLAQEQKVEKQVMESIERKKLKDQLMQAEEIESKEALALSGNVEQVGQTAIMQQLLQAAQMQGLN